MIAIIVARMVGKEALLRSNSPAQGEVWRQWSIVGGFLPGADFGRRRTRVDVGQLRALQRVGKTATEIIGISGLKDKMTVKNQQVLNAVGEEMSGVGLMVQAPFFELRFKML